MESITASNISEILNNNLKELDTAPKSSFISNVINHPKFIWGVLFVVLSITTIVYMFYLYQKKRESTEIFNDIKKKKEELISQKIIDQDNLNSQLLEKQKELEEMLQIQKNSMEQTIEQVVEEKTSNNMIVEGIDGEDGLNLQNIDIDSEDIINNIERLDTDSESMEDMNIRDLNLSTKEMEMINNKLFKN